ncbi:uncharacterized protein LOC131153902 [Malania oleifera]|uniref:uncharacterized protein LOC131153902 n=1 Tax=Malania oleifera TaxID=397392 RepID=UPI0025ADBE6D|nr:uncharacterized protein LOC131153902 [Malania oleifera]
MQQKENSTKNTQGNRLHTLLERSQVRQKTPCNFKKSWSKVNPITLTSCHPLHFGLHPSSPPHNKALPPPTSALFCHHSCASPSRTPSGHLHRRPRPRRDAAMSTVHMIPFQLLEITLLSAQDLAPVSKSMHTYAVAWVHPERRLTTRVDQQGRANPTWNDKFVFRVDDHFLASDTSAIMIEIYAVSWLRDVRIGTVRLLVNNLVSTSTRTSDGLSTTRFVALQVRRPSGRPQGILNVGITLLDSAMRSMPLYTELSASAVGFQDLIDGKLHKKQNPVEEKDKEIKPGELRRTQSERTENTKPHHFPARPGSSICNGSIYNGDSICNGSMINDGGGMGSVGGSIVNGGGGNGSICSDVGPSPSVVAAAVAKGLYLPPRITRKDAGSSLILDDWTVESSVEGLKSKLERWRTELPPVHDRGERVAVKPRRNQRHARRHTDGGGGGGGGGLFSCFANAYGCEFSITCGTKSKKKYRNGKAPLNREEEDNLSQSYI